MKNKKKKIKSNKKEKSISNKDFNFSVKKEIKELTCSFIQRIVIDKINNDENNYTSRRSIYELHIIKINDLIDIYNKNMKKVLSSNNKKAIEFYERAYFHLMSLTNDENVDTIKTIFDVHSYINKSLSIIDNE